MRTLVTGGIRSGKSRYAEWLVRSHERVTYIAAGGPGRVGDPEWTERVRAHQARRPNTWTTAETTDLESMIDEATGPVLVDCLGTWLTAIIDDAGLWVDPGAARAFVQKRAQALAAAMSRAPHDVVLVTNEVGLSLVSEHASGRLFQDALGSLNATVGSECDEVVLVVAGRPLVLPRPAAEA